MPSLLSHADTYRKSLYSSYSCGKVPETGGGSYSGATNGGGWCQLAELPFGAALHFPLCDLLQGTLALFLHSIHTYCHRLLRLAAGLSSDNLGSVPGGVQGNAAASASGPPDYVLGHAQDCWHASASLWQHYEHDSPHQIPPLAAYPSTDYNISQQGDATFRR